MKLENIGAPVFGVAHRCALEVSLFYQMHAERAQCQWRHITKAGMDPAHAGPSIQVIMDVMGVAITCIVCKMMLAPAPDVGGGTFGV